VSLIATNIQSRAGVISFDIDVAGSDTNFDIIDMSSLDYEYDLVTSEDQLTYVSAIPGSMTIKAVDKLSNMGSMFQVLENKLGNYNVEYWYELPVSNANLVLHSRVSPGTTYRFPFKIRYSDLQYDERSGHLSIAMSPQYTNYTVSQWGAQRASIYAADVIEQLDYTTTGAGAPTFVAAYTDTTTVLAGDFIYDVVALLNQGSGNQNVYKSARNIGKFTTIQWAGTTYTNANYGAFPRRAEILEYGPGTYVPNFQFDPVKTSAFDNDLAIDKVKQFAAMEGAIFGSAFNINFYINRQNKDNQVTITNNDLSDIKFQRVGRYINSITYKFNAGVAADSANARFFPSASQTVRFDAWLDAPQSLVIDYSKYTPFLLIGGLETSETYGYASNSAAFGNTTMRTDYLDSYVQNITRAATNAYAPPLGVTLTERNIYTIEFEMIGAEKLKPHQPFVFDQSVPTRYQDKIFRPSSLSYDFMSDKVTVRAYQLGAGTSPTTTTTTSTTTTSTTTTSTTTTTTTTLAQCVEYLMGFGLTAAEATKEVYTGAANYIYLNNPVITSATMAYTSDTCTTPLSQAGWYSNGLKVVEINSSGQVLQVIDALTQFNNIDFSIFSGAGACTAYPGTKTLYGNDTTFSASTIFIELVGSTYQVFNGEEIYWSDGSNWKQIDNDGTVMSSGSC
jgi:hypothetical protein